MTDGGDVASRYPPIESHGVIGDLQTAALVGMDGRIDFLCLPAFDSPSVFVSLLDSERGGEFSLRPAVGGATRKQLYLPDTNVLMTRFLSEDGVAGTTSGTRRSRRSSATRAPPDWTPRAC